MATPPRIRWTNRSVFRSSTGVDISILPCPTNTATRAMIVPALAIAMQIKPSVRSCFSVYCESLFTVRWQAQDNAHALAVQGFLLHLRASPQSETPVLQAYSLILLPL